MRDTLSFIPFWRCKLNVSHRCKSKYCPRYSSSAELLKTIRFHALLFAQILHQKSLECTEYWCCSESDLRLPCSCFFHIAWWDRPPSPDAETTEMAGDLNFLHVLLFLVLQKRGCSAIINVWSRCTHQPMTSTCRLPRHLAVWKCFDPGMNRNNKLFSLSSWLD